MHTEDTISAISTPFGRGGIGIVRLSGPIALRIVKNIFRCGKDGSGSLSTSHKACPGEIIDPAANKAVDEALVTFMKAPHSYTREDVVEISCHGGMAVLSKVLDLTLKEGARLALPGEFTRRAFLNGRIDLTQAEAVIDLINAKSEQSIFNTVSILNGSVSREVDQLRSALIEISSKLELSIDFTEDDVPSTPPEEIKRSLLDVKKTLERLIESYDSGRLLREGIKVVIAGRTNAGKSSLFNLLLKKERAIVTRHPGTTRDYIKEELTLGGATYNIFDTAGIRNSNHEIESEGIERSYDLIDNADIILLVLSASEDLTEEDISLIKRIKSKNKECLYLLNKIDLEQKIDSKQMSEFSGISSDKILKISVKKNIGIEELKDQLRQIITSSQAVSDTEKTIICNLRHKNLLDEALECVNTAIKACEASTSEEFITFDVTRALNSLDEITGRSCTDDVLEKIFNEFCIGK